MEERLEHRKGRNERREIEGQLAQQRRKLLELKEGGNPPQGSPPPARPDTPGVKPGTEGLARYLSQELNPLDWERAPEAREERIEQLLKMKEGWGGGPVVAGTFNQRLLGRKPNSEVKTETPFKPKGQTSSLRWVAESIASEDHGDRNEDRFVVIARANAAAVFDGVSDANQAAQAAELAAADVQQALNALDPGTPADDLPKILRVILLETNEVLRKAQADASDQQLATTATLAVITQRGDQPVLAWASVGDSRVSVWQKASGRYQLTTLDDHLLRLLLNPASQRPQWVGPLLKRHNQDPYLQLDPKAAGQLATTLDLHPDPARTSPLAKFLFAERNLITQSLGAGPVSPHTGLMELKPGDRVLLATDGIHDNLAEPELVRILSQTNFDEVATALAVRAHEVSLSGAPRAKKDDITTIVLEVTSS